MFGMLCLRCAGFLERPALPAPVDPPPLPPIGGNGVTPVKPKRAEKEIVGAMGRLQVTAGATPPPLPAKTITYIDDDGSSNEVYEATPLCDGATDGLVSRPHPRTSSSRLHPHTPSSPSLDNERGKLLE